jgi:nitric oxide dioxygenase
VAYCVHHIDLGPDERPCSHANQVRGHQAESLAGALYAYAGNIDNLDALGPAVGKITHKHASLYVKPEQYAVVGEYLLKAMGTILGDAFTPQILDAWTAAYNQLADIMIGMERDMLKEAREWTDWRDFIISEKVYEAEDVMSLYLEPKDRNPLPPYLPGQYVSLSTNVPDLQYSQPRQYSLSSKPEQGHYRVTIKKEPAAIVGTHPGYLSTVLFNNKKAGDIVQVSYPRGDFVLDTSKPIAFPIVLLSAGVGLTPMVAMVDTLISKDHKPPISWVHSTRNSRSQVFAQHLQSLRALQQPINIKLFNKEGDGQGYDFEGRMDLRKLDKTKDLYVDDETTRYFICGPESFMTDMQDVLESYGVKKEQIKLEIFGTALLTKQ